MPRGVGSGAGEPADGLSNYLVLWIVLFSVTIRDADSAAAGAGLGYMDPGRAPIAEDLPDELVGERERPGAEEPLDARRRPRRRFGPSTLLSASIGAGAVTQLFEGLGIDEKFNN